MNLIRKLFSDCEPYCSSNLYILNEFFFLFDWLDWVWKLNTIKLSHNFFSSIVFDFQTNQT